MHQENLQSIYEYLRDQAQSTLTGNLSFAPFAAAIRQTGEKTHLQAELLADDSTPQEHIGGLIDALRQEDATVGLIAAGLVFDAQAQTADGPQASLCFHIEVASGEALEVMLPYQRPDGVAVTFSEPQLQPVYPEIFTASAQP